MDSNNITYFAETDYRNKRMPFGIKDSDRTRHVYVIGKTGMGKSTLLENMAIQDIRNGNSLAFVDPHGKTAELLLDYIPENRIDDVLYFAPFDMDYPVSFNVMEDVGPDKRHLVVNGLMSTFEKIWVDAWSARMAYILQNSLLALLEYPGSTLLGINRILSDKDYRKMVIANIKDPAVRSFWVDEFSKYTDRYTQEATPAIQNKVGQFTSNPLIRNIIGQPKSTFDLRKMMDGKKIVIVNLSKGRVGEGNANLLGSMIITKIYLAAMSRADVPEKNMKNLPNFYLYVDEFQSFANKSFADILSEARKYKLNLTIAHQYIEQMEEEVQAAVFGNVGTMVTFRVGAYDAEVLEKEFAPVFTAEDLVNLGIFQVYMKLMIDGVSSSPFSAITLPPIEKPGVSFKEQVIESSRKQFAHSRADVEKAINEWHAPIIKPAENAGKDRPVARPAGDFRESKPSGSGQNLPRETGGRRRDYEKREKTFIGQQAGAERPARDFSGVAVKEPSAKPVVPPAVESPKPPPAERRELPPVSLNELKNPAIGAKIGGKSAQEHEKNILELREALSSLVKKGKPSGGAFPRSAQGGGFSGEPKPAPTGEVETKNRMAEQFPPKPREVPEEVLKKILSDENPKK